MSGPTLRLGGAVGVVTVAVCVQTGGFQKLQRSWGSEGDPERPCWRERCFALHAESTSPYLFRSKDSATPQSLQSTALAPVNAAVSIR